jgi:hypothetical protein
MAGVITEKAFNTHIEGPGGNSFIDFGPEVYANLSSENDGVVIKFDDGYFWNTKPRGIRFG